MNLRETVENWVNSFNSIPLSLIIKAYSDLEGIYEITPCQEECYDFFPMWGTMWTFGDKFDEEWAYSHLEEMAECGFRIYECDELGLVFGIDGAGYDFYEKHWIPLYLARTGQIY